MHLEWRNKIPGENCPEIWTSLLDSEATELASLAKGNRVLEIGAAYGYSACVMAQSAKHVTTIDSFIPIPARRIVQGNLVRCGVSDKVRIIEEWSFFALPKLVDQGKKFDLVFIDGDHSYEGVTKDLASVVQLTNGIIACHDYLEECCCPGVKIACHEFFPNGPSHITGSMAVYLP